ncbi:flagellar hook capping FlgD N-terminal domain-containing protein [Cryptosporangium arvum]|uniref:Basal-body rod modification protein FlgD n=1 Tax=Cryptosporangium arvum DSM 44712 TaxID=927661 RepID=A0A011AG19_9ACTN|nr:flagellar hook capping FlgD N-terminal domain-containing protein [Cryptosporangium arvum]EXG80971.1 flagellar hook capping protein [Cryptosporangium arvum DSM 44712]
MTAPLSESSNVGATLNQALGAAPVKPPSADLDKDAFLKLLVAQLKYQDPMNPAQGTEFVAQTAQFTTVEKLTDLAEVQQQMLTAQLTLGAANLVGKDVTYTDATGNSVTGKVEGATLGSNPSVTVNGLSIPMSSVTAVGKVGLATSTSPVAGGSGDMVTPIGDAVPGATTPQSPLPTTVPGTTAPGGPTSPGTTAPGTTAPGGTAAPGTTAPGTTTPGTTTPGTAAPGGTAPGGVSTGSPDPATASPTTPPGPTTPGTAPDATDPGA